MKQETLEEVAERLTETAYQNEEWEKGRLKRMGYYQGLIDGAKWQQDKMYSEEELRNAMNWMLTQYFEFHEWPAMGRVDHYVQSIKSE